MARPVPLPVRDRKTGKLFREFSPDLASTYESRPARSPTAWLEAQPAYDWLVAAVQHSRFSARKIDSFIKKHKIDMREFEPVMYRSYSDFFTRRFRDGMRSFPKARTRMGAFAEARYFAWSELDPAQQFPIKGHSLDLEQLLGNKSRARPFIGGPILLARLSPVDYHHIHYPDDGRTLSHFAIGGRLWTINWKALQSKPDILFRNERHVQFLQTRNFGRLGFVEIGAMTVGRVIRVHDAKKPFRRGNEKAYFDFGGSAVVVFGEKGHWIPSRDLLQNTQDCVETFVRLGEPIANAPRRRSRR
jgi:phosphatidylserine decarboxylase